MLVNGPPAAGTYAGKTMRKAGAIFLAASLVAGMCLPASTARADSDLAAQAAGMLAAMEGNAARVATMLRQARAARPPPAAQVKCIDAALSRVDVAVRSGKDDVAQVRTAIRAGDASAAHRALVALGSKRQAARDATMEADACRAGLPHATEGTVVRVVVDRSLPSDSAVFKH